MKIAISGKGGTGKTTLTALLGYLYAKDRKVFLIDTDPDGNLGNTIGIDKDRLSKVTPVVEMKEIIKERTGSKGDGFFKLNPKVDDIPEKFSLRVGNLRLLILGTMKKGGGGCFCPENAFLKTLLSHMLVGRDEVVLLDMPAGIEHLGRGTAKAVDCFIIVVEPTMKSVQTAGRVERLSKDIGIEHCYIVGNKIKNDDDVEFIRQKFDNNKFLGYTNYNDEIIKADRENMPVFELAKESLNDISKIKEKLNQIKSNWKPLSSPVQGGSC
jgi:CO dehydrogenase maturation factor